MKSILRYIYYLPYTCLNRIQYLFKGVKAGKRHETRGVLYIKNKGTIHIGDNVRIISSHRANPIGCGYATYFQVLKRGKLIIGNGTRLSNTAITASSSVIIGEHVRIGAGVKIYDTDFHSIKAQERTSSPEITANISKKPIQIKDYAFIGAGAFILKGVTIGHSAIIGAGAVVTKDVGNNEIWAGNPAKKIGIS